MHANVTDFSIWGRLTRPRGHFRAQGSALTRNVDILHGSKNLLQRGTLYRHEKILLGREDCRPGPKKTIYKNLMVFHPYLGIAVFVWARAFCGTRIDCCAAVDCSGTAQNIYIYIYIYIYAKD